MSGPSYCKIYPAVPACPEAPKGHEIILLRCLVLIKQMDILLFFECLNWILPSFSITFGNFGYIFSLYSYCPPPKIHDPAYVAQNQLCLVKIQLIEKKIAKAQTNCAIPQRDIVILQKVIFSYFWLFIVTVEPIYRPRYQPLTMIRNQILMIIFYKIVTVILRCCLVKVVFFKLCFNDFLWFSGDRLDFSFPN